MKRVMMMSVVGVVIGSEGLFGFAREVACWWWNEEC